MNPACWPCPSLAGAPVWEYALASDRGRTRRLLIVPALFDEGNRMRRLTVEAIRRLDAAGIDSFLPDLPGCNESPQPLPAQTVQAWRGAMTTAAAHFGATHTLGIRGGSLFTPALPARHYAPVKAASILRNMIRARTLAAREAGREETREELMAMARTEGIVLSGYALGPEFCRAFEEIGAEGSATIIAQEQVGGAGLWLRAEPDEDAAQADALAAIIAEGLTP